MGKYKIFIDESGNFDDLNPLSLVGGYISTMEIGEIEKNVDDIFGKLKQNTGIRNRTLRHSTELKHREGNRAFKVIETVFEEVELLPFDFFLMSNELDVRIENPDNTYLNMLLDAVSNIIFNIYANDNQAEFVIYPAIKKRNSVIDRHLSREQESRMGFDEIFIQEYKGNFIQKIRNLFLQTGKEMPDIQVVLKSARSFPPLFICDYLCNTVYNRDKEPSKSIFEQMILPKLKYNYQFSLTAIANQIDTSLYNGNLHHAFFSLLKGYEGIESFASDDHQKEIIEIQLERQKIKLTEYFNKPENQEKLEWAMIYLLKNLEHLSKSRKRYKRDMFWYQKLMAIIENMEFRGKERVLFLILTDFLSLKNRSGYTGGSDLVRNKLSELENRVSMTYDFVLPLLYFYNVAAVSEIMEGQFEAALIRLKKPIDYFNKAQKFVPDAINLPSDCDFRISDLGKINGTFGRLYTMKGYFDNSPQNFIKSEEFLTSANHHFSKSENIVQGLCYQVNNTLIQGDCKTAYTYLKKIAGLVDFNEKSDFIESFFYKDKPLPLFTLMKWINAPTDDSELNQAQKEAAVKLSSHLNYFSEINRYHHPYSSLLTEWVYLRYRFFEINNVEVIVLLLEQLKNAHYQKHIAMRLMRVSFLATYLLMEGLSDNNSDMFENLISELNFLAEPGTGFSDFFKNTLNLLSSNNEHTNDYIKILEKLRCVNIF